MTTDNKVLRVYKFGVGRNPTGDSLTLFMNSFKLAHNQQNRLIALERDRREEVRQAQANCTAIAQAQAVVDSISLQRKNVRSTVDAKYEQQLKTLKGTLARMKKRKEKTTEVAAEIKDLKETIKQEKATLTKSTKAALDAAIAKLKDTKEQVGNSIYKPIDEKYKALVKHAINCTGPYEGIVPAGWTQKSAIAASCKQGFNKLVSNMSPENDPSFSRFSPGYRSNNPEKGKHTIGINQTKSTNAKTLAGYNNPNGGLLYIPKLPPPEAYGGDLTQGQRRKLQRTDVYVRVGTTEVPGKRGEPVWALLPDVIFHREIKPWETVVAASVNYERNGTKDVWSLVLQTHSAQEHGTHTIPETMDTCTVDLIARRGDMQVQYGALNGAPLVLDISPRTRTRRIQGKSGKYGIVNHEDQRLPMINGNLVDSNKDLVDLDDKRRHLHHAREANFDDHIPKVLIYINTATQLPECLIEAKTNHVDKWKSKSKFSKLYYAWKAERMEGDEEAFAHMEKWAKQDAHLYQWDRSTDSRMQNRRKDVFRKKAFEICSKYQTIRISGEVFAEQKKKSTIDTGLSEVDTKIRHVAKLSARGEFREILKNTAKRMGRTVELF